MIVHGEGFETFALTDDRTALDDAYDFLGEVANADATIVAGRTLGGKNPHGQGMQCSVDDAISVNFGMGWHLNIGGLTSDTTLIRSYALYGTYPDINWPLLQFYDYDTNAMCSFVITSTGAVQFRRGGVAGTLIDSSAAGVIADEDWSYLEFKVKFNDTTGTYQLKVDQSSVLSGTGVDTTAQGTRCYQISHGVPRNAWGAWIYDDALLIDTQVGATGNEAVDFLGDVYLERVIPNGTGTTNDWTASAAVDHYTLIDEDGEDGNTTYLESKTVDQIDRNHYEDVSGTAVIYGVVARPVVRKTDTGSAFFKLDVESNSTVSVSDKFYPSTDYMRESYVWETDPDTSDLWTVAAFNASQYGIRPAA